MRETKWFLYTKRADFDNIAKEFDISNLLAKIITNRNIAKDDISTYLKSDISLLNSPYELKDLKEACAYITESIKAGKKIRIVGDYDIDGVCATYIYVKAFKRLGANVDYEIPHRIKDGYGINELMVEKAKEDEIELIVTCDNGIAAFKAMEEAKSLGIDVIISDHHEVFKEQGKDKLPTAKYIINPQRADCTYPFKGICGAFVAYKLVEALYEEFNISKEELYEFIEFAGIATIGDVMKLENENRYLVKESLERIKNTKNIGLKTLIEVCDLQDKRLSPYHIGFIIGPCINAGGRLKSAKLAMKLFLEEDKEAALSLASQLSGLNEERKDMTAKGVELACNIVEDKYINDNILIVYLSDCHESLAGIIAGRVKEKYFKPTIIFTDTEDGYIKGSARSIESYDMFKKLQEADSLLYKYGGHKMAAGMTIEANNLDILRKFLNTHSDLSSEDFIEKKWIDIALPFSYISKEFIHELELLEPFGNGNEKPCFAQKDVEILSIRILGKNNNVVKMNIKDTYGSIMEALMFTDGEEFIKTMDKGDICDILYYPDINIYMGRESIQIIINDIKTKKL